MVCTRLPQYVAPPHALKADHNVLQRVVERVPHMKRTGNIWWRDHNAIWIGAALGTGGCTRFESSGVFPFLVEAFLNIFGDKILFQHAGSHEIRGKSSLDQYLQKTRHRDMNGRHISRRYSIWTGPPQDPQEPPTGSCVENPAKIQFSKGLSNRSNKAGAGPANEVAGAARPEKQALTTAPCDSFDLFAHKLFDQ